MPQSDHAQSLSPLGCRVLLACAVPTVQRALAADLRACGVEVDAVADGDAAVEAALSQSYALVLVDAGDPALDARSAVALLRGAGYGRPMLALVAQGGPGPDVACSEGFDGLFDARGGPARLHAELMPWLAGAAEASLIDDEAFRLELEALAAEFRAGLPAQLDAMQAALERMDAPGLRSLAHTLKGSAGSYGFAALTQAAAEVERELVAGRWAAAAAACAALIAQARSLLGAG